MPWGKEGADPAITMVLEVMAFLEAPTSALPALIFSKAGPLMISGLHPTIHQGLARPLCVVREKAWSF